MKGRNGRSKRRRQLDRRNEQIRRRYLELQKEGLSRDEAFDILEGMEWHYRLSRSQIRHIIYKDI